MMLPLDVLNRLRQGKAVAARVAPEHPGNLAWVYVSPFLDPDQAFWLQGRIYRTGSGNPIRGFLVRYVEAEPQVVEEFHRYDQDDLSRTAADVIFRDGQPLVLLDGEIHRLIGGESTMDDEPLPVDEIWWRGLVDLEP